MSLPLEGSWGWGDPGAGGVVGLRKKRRRKGERGLINQCEIGASVACSHSTTLSL